MPKPITRVDPFSRPKWITLKPAPKPPIEPCDGAAEVVAALGLACELQGAPPPADLSKPPNITSLDDLAALGAFLKHAGTQLANQAGRMYVENVPTSVLQDFHSRTVGTGNNAGTMGQTRLEMGENLEAMRTHWRHIGETLAQMGLDIESARVSEEMAFDDLDEANHRLAIERAQSYFGMAEAAARALGHAGDITQFANPGSTAADIAIAGLEAKRHIIVSGHLADIKAIEQDKYESTVAKILNDLQSTILGRMSSLEDSMAALRTAVSDAKQNGSQLDGLAGQANYEAAVAAGAPFYVDPKGNVVEMPVNTILNRQYDVTRNRYRKALTEARYLAFLARLAIEQRIGERLDAVSFPTTTGPLESPGLWADDVCNMTGIDFEKYKDAPLPEWAKEDPGSGPITIPADLINPQYRRNLLGFFVQEGTIDQLSKQYIGDYVSRLETFITYYNTEYPSHDGDDTTVLSFRDELMGDNYSCEESSRNLLYYSGQIGHGTASEEAPSTSGIVGWQINSCDYTNNKCLVRLAGDDDPPVMPPIPGATVTWLAEDRATISLEPNEPPLDEGQIPPRTVSQQVYVGAGSYVLSWWDHGLPPYNQQEVVFPPPRTRTTLTVSVTDDEGTSLVTWQDRPALSWSERRAVGFDVDHATLLTVNVTISAPGEPRGSMALAGMQLERATSATSSPSGYVENGATTVVVSQSCPPSEVDLQNAFIRGVDANGRPFFELSTPIAIKTDRLGDPNYLNGKLAQGNFNYRHVDLAVNLVGTGLVDCTGQPATCRDTNTVDYTLAHDAHSIQLRGVGGLLRFFDFGEAFINDGRALASEIEVETPVSTEYGALLQQGGVTKTEYMGRPLDGIYRLRIWDRTGLSWSRLKDIQLVLKYRYWSAIDKAK